MLLHPSLDHGASLPPRSEVSLRVDAACDQIRALSIPLVQELERRHPGHPFGWKKFGHMEHLMGEVTELAGDLRLTEREMHLLRLVARAHDIGRHKEALDQLDTLRPGPRHGHISATLLREYGVLDSFDSAEREAVLDAVIQHAEREVSLSPGLARTLCYVIRDTEKLDIFRDPKYRSPEGILEQVRLHYLNDEDRGELSGSEEVRNFVLEHILEAPRGTPCPEHFEPTARATIEKIGAIMSTGVTPTLLDQFGEMRPLAVQDIRYSYASYELFQIAFIFDIQGRGVLEAIRREHHLDAKLEFLARRLPPAQMTRIHETVDGYLEKRGVRG